MKSLLTIFDIDGTLVNSSNTLCLLFKDYIFSKTQKRIELYDIYPKLQLPYQVILEHFEIYKEEDISEFEQKLKQKSSYHIDLFPGVYDILNYLKNISYISTATNMSESVAKNILENLKISEHFDLIIGLNTRLRSKPDPDMIFESIDSFNINPQNVYFIGDSISDMTAAKNAGVKSVFIKHYQEKILSSNMTDYQIDELMDLTKIIY